MPVALITGATSGFGEACARLFAKNGWSLIISGRRSERLDALAKELDQTPVHAVTLDVRDKAAVDRAVAELPPAFAAIDLLVNNAGLSLGFERAHEGSAEDWETMVDTNVKGLLNVTHAVLPGMVERDHGHVVNLGSIAGNYPYLFGNVYGASKAFVGRFTQNLKADLLGTKVRVTNIEPGMAETEFGKVRFKWDAEKAAKAYENMTPLTAEDIAETIYWAASRPPHVTVTSIEIWPTQQSFGFFSIHRDEE
ncbi:MAG: SDR family oxidoreductase [Desulfovibrio sp.]|nr:MAG: SDR family oxidoreductase [Desulfovibrio sp.]